MSTFTLDFEEFAKKAVGNAVVVFQKVAIDALSSCVKRSPVGNPELWAANAHATQYNNAVDSENTRLRADPANLNKGGRLKAGRKIKDSMPIVAGAGYVGGQFRGNWQVAFEVAPTSETGVIDGNGSATIAAGAAVIQAFTSSVGSIWLMNNVPYAQRLEDGHSTQAPNGMVRLTVVEIQQYINQAVRELPD
ncbi:MAG: hypothetical protein K2X80_07255 [Pseudomonadaceae bacterium]|nr:hypothetical protein [Pseudomonadaceae bacterium]